VYPSEAADALIRALPDSARKFNPVSWEKH
jgi:hypothetical protein